MSLKGVLEAAFGILVAGFVAWLGLTVVETRDVVKQNNVVINDLREVEDGFQGLAFAIARAHPEIRVSQMLQSPELRDLSVQELERALDLIHSDSAESAWVYLEERGIPTATVETMVGPVEQG